MSLGRVIGGVVEVGFEDYARLSKLDRPRAAKPIAEWPVAMRLIARHRTPGEAGLGDTAARWIGHVGGEKFKLWFHVVFGRDCGCADRQSWLNARWPYLGGEAALRGL